MNHPVLNAVVPVALLITLGYFTGRRGWVGRAAVGDISNLVFLVLAPALLFRSMSTIHLQDLDWRPVVAYFGAAAVIFAAVLALRGMSRRAAVLGLAATYSNLAMIGIPLVSFIYGEAGMPVLLAIISVHSLLLLGTATLVLELAVLHEQRVRGEAGSRPIGRTVALALRNAIIHPVPLPIMAGLLYAQTGWPLPQVIDRPLQILGSAFAPIALMLVGVVLAGTHVGPQRGPALRLALLKNLLHPLLVLALGWALGLSGLPLAIAVLAGTLPMGANVFVFSQRYGVAQDTVTAAVVFSTVLGLVSVSLALLVTPHL